MGALETSELIDEKFNDIPDVWRRNGYNIHAACCILPSWARIIDGDQS
jgi:hypothetical protein